MITQQELLERFEYRDGELYWRKSFGPKAQVGRRVGSGGSRGYRYAHINHKKYGIHRLVFMMHHGYFPDSVDHINGNPADNRIENLRAATHSENMISSKLRTTNTTGAKNVYWDARAKSFGVSLRVNGSRFYFGWHKDLEAAELVAQLAREKYHGEFARHI